MASIRRTLSPVPRAGTLLSGEACSIASPLSKSSSYNPNYPQSPLDYALYRVQAFVLGIFSQRSSRPLERGKIKGQIWRRALVHFLISFILGVFVGLTPFVSTNLSLNLVSKHQAFSFEVIPTVEKIQMGDLVPRNVTRIVEKLAVHDNTTLHSNGFNGSSVQAFVNVTKVLVQHSNADSHKLLIIVTPTYNRPFQAYYLNRLAYTLKLVSSPLLWIVVDMSSQSIETAEVLRRTGVVYRHLVCTKNLTEVKDKRVHQRNAALDHIETHRLDGIVYFADDSNMYSVELFEQMRQIRRFGTWTVAKLMDSKSQYVLEGPICNGTRVIGWHTNDPRRRFRRFQAQMPGFAFNSTILWDPTRWQRPTLEPIRQVDNAKDGFQVSAFIEQVLEDESEMEGLPQNCSKIMVWNLDIDSSYSYPQDWLLKNNLEAVVPLA